MRGELIIMESILINQFSYMRPVAIMAGCLTAHEEIKIRQYLQI